MIVFFALLLSILLSSPVTLAQSDRESRANTFIYPPGFSVPTLTRSPNHRFGVLVPDAEHYDYTFHQNQIVDTQTGHILGAIEAEPGMMSMNHGGVRPARWSRDGSLLLWEVEGKWCPRALVLLKISGDHIVWQRDLLKTAQHAILVRTHQARPKQYAAAKKANKGSGSYFPDGFTVDVRAAGKSGAPVSLPLKITATLTSNPKENEDFPKAAQLDATLVASVTPDGTFQVRTFRLERTSK
jgi:hypothetical protein